MLGKTAQGWSMFLAGPSLCSILCEHHYCWSKSWACCQVRRQIHYFMWRTSRSLGLSQKGCFLRLFLPWKKARKQRKKLPQSDLLVCSLQLLLHIHNCTWMLDKHGVKIDKNILLKRSISF